MRPQRVIWAGLLVLLGLVWAGSPASAQPVQAKPDDPAYLALFPAPQTMGQIPVALHPDPRATGEVMVVGFGVPFPPGFVKSPDNIWLKDDMGKEMPIFVKTLAIWNQPAPHAGSLRVVLVQFRDLMAVATPRTYTLGWGATPRKESEPQGWPNRSGWLPAPDKTLAAAGVLAPPVYAVLPPAWLGQSLLKGPILPAGKSKVLPFYDQFMEVSWGTAVNRLDPRVGERFRFKVVDDHEPWLYDRGATLYVAYLRRGGLDYLKEAHLASQYYATQIMPNGKFRLLGEKKDPDLKYGYQECLALDYWLTGDERMLDISRNVLKLLDIWDPTYGTGRTFWTERHLGLALLNAITAYEMLGDPKVLERARFIFNAAYEHQFNPPSGVPKDGCWVHTGRQHNEKAEGQICSVWMSSLVVDAMLRYYLVTADPRVPKSIEALADFVVRHGTYKNRPHPTVTQDLTFPHYLIGSGQVAHLEFDPWTDREHALDTAMILAMADFFATKSGRAKPEYRRLVQELFKTADWNFQDHYHPDGPEKSQIPPLTILPPRKFNWWFRTTANLDWFLTNTGR